MGGAQPLAVTMNGGVVPDRRRRPDPARPPGATRATSTRWPTTSTTRSSACLAAKRDRRALSVGVVGNAADGAPRAAAPRRRDRHRHRPDLGARPADATCPRASTSTTGTTTPTTKPEEFTDRARASMAKHVEAMVGFLDAGAEVFDYGNSIRGEAQLGGYERAFAFPGFVPAYIRPLFCEGKGPFRWAALSGDPADIAATDRAILELFPDNEPAAPLDPAGRRAGRLPGPAGPHLLARLRRARPGRAAVQRDGRRPASCSAPIVIGRDHLDCGSVASPVPGDRGDARRLRRDRRLAAAQRAGQHRRPARPGCPSTTAAASASAGRSTPARSRVADGTALAAQKIERVLHQRPGHGRHPPRRRRLRPRRRGRRASAASASRWRRA